MFQTKAVDKIKTHIFFENFGTYEIMWKNVIEEDWPHQTVLYGACALHAG